MSISTCYAACVDQRTFGCFEIASDVLRGIRDSIIENRDEIPLAFICGSGAGIKDGAQDMNKAIINVEEAEALAVECALTRRIPCT